MKVANVWFIGLVFVVCASAEPLLEGRVRLESGEPVADAQVRLFDLTDLRQGAVARAQTDGTGYFALPLAALRGSALPEAFALGPNYPNPFNPSTIIPYQLAASAEVRLEVFNLLGQRIATLVDGARPAGFHTATWHATDAAGRAVGAGVYIYRMTVGVESLTGRMVLVDGQAGVSVSGASSVMLSASGVGGSDGEGAQMYGLVVSGSGLVPYVDSSFRVEAGMASVELVVSAGQHPAGKATDDDCPLCDFFDAFNDLAKEKEKGPDLIVQSPSVSDTTLTPGQEFTLNVTVHNQGDAQAAATMLHYYRSNNSTITSSDTEVGTDAIDALDASASSAESIALTAPTGGGPEVYFGACVASVSDESNADNNCSSAVRVTVGGQETLEEDDETGEEGEEETLTISSDMVTLPPPTWVFVGDVPAAYQTALREEMEQCRAYFAERFGVEATGFTVLVGANFASLDPVYRDALGEEFPFIENPTDIHAFGFVTQHRVTGDIFVTLVYRGDFPTLKHIVVHEYFHVLQRHLPSGFAGLRAPRWLVEGLASYADYAYTLSTPDRYGFLGDRFTPYADIADAQVRGAFGEMDNLVGLEDMQTFRCDFDEFYSYAMSFAASAFLIEQIQVEEENAFVTFWKLLGDRPWQQAFEEAFGLDVEDFYSAFDEWLPSQLPSTHLIQNQIRYTEGQSLVALDRTQWEDPFNPYQLLMSLILSPHDVSSHTVRAKGSSTNFVLKFHGRPFKTAHIGLRLTALGASPSDQCNYLLGWYKDGELTDQLEEATLVEFTGTSTSLEWTLPDHPSKLPRHKLPGWACDF